MLTQLDEVKNYKNEEKFQKLKFSFCRMEQAKTTALLQWKDAEMTFKAKTASEWKDFEEIAY